MGQNRQLFPATCSNEWHYNLRPKQKIRKTWSQVGLKLEPRAAPWCSFCSTALLAVSMLCRLAACPLSSLHWKADGGRPTSNNTLEDFVYIQGLYFNSTYPPRILEKGRNMLPILGSPFWALAVLLKTTASENQGRNEHQLCLLPHHLKCYFCKALWTLPVKTAAAVEVLSSYSHL